MTVIAHQSLLPGFRPVITYDNFMLAGNGIESIVASSTAEGNMVADNLKSPLLGAPWRSGSVSEWVASGRDIMHLIITLEHPRLVTWWSQHRSNIRVPFYMKLFSGGGPQIGEAPFYQSGWINTIVREKPGAYQGLSQTMPFSLGITEREVQKLQAAKRLDSFIAAPSPGGLAKTIVISYYVGDGTGTKDDFLQLGFGMLTEFLQPKIGVPFGNKWTPKDRTKTKRLESGSLEGRTLSTGMEFKFTVPHSEPDEAFGPFLDWMEAGKTNRCGIWINGHTFPRKTFHKLFKICTLASMNGVTMAHLDLPGLGFVAEETE